MSVGTEELVAVVGVSEGVGVVLSLLNSPWVITASEPGPAVCSAGGHFPQSLGPFCRCREVEHLPKVDRWWSSVTRCWLRAHR